MENEGFGAMILLSIIGIAAFEFDFNPSLWGSKTLYYEVEDCITSEECTTKYEWIRFRVDVDSQSVHMLRSDGEIFHPGLCTVFDGTNWRCDYLLHSQGFGMSLGQWQDAPSHFTTYRSKSVWLITGLLYNLSQR